PPFTRPSGTLSPKETTVILKEAALPTRPLVGMKELGSIPSPPRERVAKGRVRGITSVEHNLRITSQSSAPPQPHLLDSHTCAHASELSDPHSAPRFRSCPPPPPKCLDPEFR